MSGKEAIAKRKRSNSLVDIVKEEGKKCSPPTDVDGKDLAASLDKHIAPVITRLDQLQDSIGRLLDMCLQEEQEGYSDGEKY